MRLDGMNDRRGFLVLLGKVYTDLDMAALDLVVDRLADVMQQACAARLNRVETQLARQLDYPGQIKVNMVRETRAIDYAK